MKVEISKQELEALDTAIHFAIKSSAFMQIAAITDPTGAPIKLEDILRANISMSHSLNFINKAKQQEKKE